MSNCSRVALVPPDSSYETFGQPVKDWMARLDGRFEPEVPNIKQTMGDLEREIVQQTQGLECKLLEEARPKRRPTRVRRYARLVATSSAGSVMATSGRIKPGLDR